MSEQKRILVVVDPTASSHPSIERAAWLAQHTQSRIELFISDYAPQLVDARSHGVASLEAHADFIDRHCRRLEQLAAALDGDVHVFHAFDVVAAIAASTDAMTMPIALPVNGLADALRAEHTEAVERLRKVYEVPPECTHLLEGGTRQLLLTLTEKLRADAVVMGAVSRSRLKGLFLGSTAEDVLDRLHCDLIIVKPKGFRAELPS